jgi:thiamine-monophosphate kinase
MSELDFIQRLRQRVPVYSQELIAGVGDDCAIIRPRGAKADLLVTTDMMIEGVHFRSGDDPEYVGRKALARALSDIAAMGGEPKFCFVSIAAPSQTTIERLYAGILPLAGENQTTVAGGDLSRSETIMIDIVVQGVVPRGEALRRDTARPGHKICCSGPLGRAASRDYVDMPEPRLRYGRNLRHRATACIDISDGLAVDLYRLCVASGVRADIIEVPTYPGATLEQALHGGDDYELLFTLPNPKMPARRGLFIVGRILAGDPAITYCGEPIEPLGHDHFRKLH